jgi:hypothetical protein
MGTEADLGTRWLGLFDENHSFLAAALQTARLWVPGVRLVFFGSRAASGAEPISDYDLLFFFPDEHRDQHQGQAVGKIDSLARGAGIELDVRGPWKVTGSTRGRSAGHSSGGSSRVASRCRDKR